MIPVKGSEIGKYIFFFKNCVFDVSPDGLAIFDKNEEYIGTITNEYFTLYSRYSYYDEVVKQLSKHKIEWVDEDIEKEIQLNRLIE